MQRLIQAGIFASGLFLMAGNGFAQVGSPFTGSITGAVSENGHPVSGYVASLKGFFVTQEMELDANGVYSFPLLPPGIYQVTLFDKAGGKEISKYDIVVTSGSKTSHTTTITTITSVINLPTDSGCGWAQPRIDMTSSSSTYISREMLD